MPWRSVLEYDKDKGKNYHRVVVKWLNSLKIILDTVSNSAYPSFSQKLQFHLLFNKIHSSF